VDIRVEVDPPAPVHVELAPLSPAPGTDGGASDGGAPAAKRVVDDPSAPFHVIRLAGLAPSTPYRYRVDAGGGHAEATFTTAPADDSGAPFTFTLYGDDRSDDVAHAAVVRAIAQAPSDFLVNTGDLVLDGADPALWQRFFEIEGDLLRERCVFPAVGNHELVEETAARFLRYFGEAAPPPGAPGAARLFRSVRWGGARFFFLNGLDTFTSGAEADWLRAELKKSHDEPGVVWRIVVVHHGLWSSGPHGDNPRLAAAGAAAMFRDAGIDVVFSGHDHIYERGERGGLKYIVSGGGGAPLYPIKAPSASSLTAESTFHFVSVQVTPAAMKLTARRADGSLLETCGFAKGASWDCPAKIKPPGPAIGPATASAEVAPKSPVDGSGAPRARCGCATPGSAPTDAGALAAALAVIAAVAARRSLRPNRSLSAGPTSS